MRREIGTLSLAITLIAAGLVWLAGNLGFLSVAAAARWWPVIIILLGAEMLLARGSAPAGTRRRLSGAAVLFLVLIAVFLASNAGGAPGSIHWGGSAGGTPGPEGQHTFTLGPEVNALHVTARAADIILMPAADGGAEGRSGNSGDEVTALLQPRGIVGTGGGEHPRDMALEYRPSGSTGVITLRQPRARSWFRGTPPARLTLQIPEKITTIRVEGGAGRIEAARLDASVFISHGSGAVRLQAIGGDVEVKNSVGDVTVDDSLPGAPGPGGGTRRVSVKNSVGEITVKTAGPLRGPYDAETSVGAVRMEMHRPGDVYIRGRASLGSVKFTDGDGFRSRGGVSSGDTLELGSGPDKVPVMLESSIGEISVRITE